MKNGWKDSNCFLFVEKSGKLAPEGFSRRMAKEEGFLYYQGETCSRKHNGFRYVSNGACIRCSKINKLKHPPTEYLQATFKRKTFKRKTLDSRIEETELNSYLKEIWD